MYAVRRPVENVYLVRERDRRRTRELLGLALSAVPPMVVLFAAIWANLETVRLGYQLQRLGKQRDTLVEKRRQLRTSRAEGAALDRVEKIARGTLGLQLPRLEQIITIHDGVLAPVSLAPAPPPVPVPPEIPAGISVGANPLPSTDSKAETPKPVTGPPADSTEEGF